MKLSRDKEWVWKLGMWLMRGGLVLCSTEGKDNLCLSAWVLSMSVCACVNVCMRVCLRYILGCCFLLLELYQWGIVAIFFEASSSFCEIRFSIPPAPLCNASENTHRHTHPIYKAWLLRTWRACLSTSYVVFFHRASFPLLLFHLLKDVLSFSIVSTNLFITQLLFMYKNLINYKDSEQWLHSNWIEVYDFCHLSHYFTNCNKKNLLWAIGWTNRYSCPRAGISLLWLAHSGFCISIQEKIK